MKEKNYETPRSRSVPVRLEWCFCASNKDSFDSYTEGIGYDNWFDGLE